MWRFAHVVLIVCIFSLKFSLANCDADMQGPPGKNAPAGSKISLGVPSGNNIVLKQLLHHKHKKAQLYYTQGYLNKLQKFWNTILWSDETKLALFGAMLCIFRHQGRS